MTSLIFSDDIHKKVRQFIIAVLPLTSRHDDVINMIPITAFYPTAMENTLFTITI